MKNNHTITPPFYTVFDDGVTWIMELMWYACALLYIIILITIVDVLVVVVRAVLRR